MICPRCRVRGLPHVVLQYGVSLGLNLLCQAACHSRELRRLIPISKTLLERRRSWKDVYLRFEMLGDTVLRVRKRLVDSALTMRRVSGEVG